MDPAARAAGGCLLGDVRPEPFQILIQQKRSEVFDAVAALAFSVIFQFHFGGFHIIDLLLRLAVICVSSIDKRGCCCSNPLIVRI